MNLFMHFPMILISISHYLTEPPHLSVRYEYDMVCIYIFTQMHEDDSHLAIALIDFIAYFSTLFRTGKIFFDTKFSMNNSMHMKNFWILVFHLF